MNTQNEKPEILKFIEERISFLDVKGLEKEAKIPNTTLQKYLYGMRVFPKKHIGKLEDFCEKWLGYVKSVQ